MCPCGNLEFRKRIRDAFNLDVAARSNIHRAAQSLREFAENLGHLRGGLEIKLVGLELHAMRIAHRLAGLNAEEHFLSVSIVVMQIVAVVGGHQGNTAFFRKPHEIAD